MTKNIATTMGVLFIVVGGLGFAVPDLMGMHLLVAHNMIHLISGALALYFGLNANPATARTFCTVFGAMYALLGLAGLVGSGPDGMLTVIPDQLMLGVRDHAVHLIAGAVFLFAGLYRKPILAGPPLP
jgi:Domain of unknown function (DUF4383)